MNWEDELYGSNIVNLNELSRSNIVNIIDTQKNIDTLKLQYFLDSPYAGVLMEGNIAG